MSDKGTQSSIRVLLADDHKVVRAGIRQFLEQDPNIQVIAEASDGQEACQFIEQHKPDVIVLDIEMPKMNGIEVTRWIRAHHLTTGVMILTAYDDDPFVQAVLKAGANGYVMKTAEPNEIVQAVLDVYHGKSVLDAALAQKLFSRLAKSDENAVIEPLTERELEVLTLAGKGLTNKVIAVQLGISDRTVQNHLANIFSKLQAENRTEAVMRAVSLGLIHSDLAGT